ncbi:hypothetical protein B0H14DRAFT_3482660 [Mycena olivaceomarginata]|nr:hypothetical protein B0H14DRAFT_3482660 [Mycena olivaceomarginata]
MDAETQAALCVLGAKIPNDGQGYRCRECKGALLFCQQCCVKRHLEHPLHLIDAWDGSRFLRTSLQALGLRVQFGHPPGEWTLITAGPDARTERGRGRTTPSFCVGAGFPASEDRPQTCMTFAALEQFHVASLQAKVTMYDYYQSLVKLTRNDGTKPPDRYQGTMQAGAEATKPGELAIRCPACPRPGINLPKDWDKASKEDRFIYTLFLALDACFRLKRGLISSELKDPGLGTGMSYMLENVPYREYLLGVTDQKEMSTCSGLAALDYANTKFSRGYSTTGVGMGVCARHEFIQPNGVGDLQKGERYANMDYIFGSILRHHDPLLRKSISYDIVCQWSVFLFERLILLPELVQCILILPWLVFVIPKMHIHAHTIACTILFSLNLIPGSGQTDGEGIERPWANVGGIASSTRIMGPGARHDAIDDHWSFWNWMKLISLADTLRRRLDNALEQQAIQREALEQFSEQQKDRVEVWKQMVHDYEEDPKKKNPYEAVVHGLTEMQVRLQFQQEEEEAAKLGLPAKHKVTLSAFMMECLQVEEEQREVHVQAELKKAKTTTQQIDMGDTYSPASIVALEKREAPAEELPENEPLFLPSALSEAERANGGCSEGLWEMEFLLRDAQCRGALGATTRARTIVGRNELKIRLHSERYQSAWDALFAMTGGIEGAVGWKKLRKADIRCMEDAEDVRRKEKRRVHAKERHKRKFQELLDHGVEVPAWAQEASEEEDDAGEDAGERGTESRREVSWIWTAAGMTGTDAALEDGEHCEFEWAKTYARSRRWDEEVRLLKEEFRRLPLSLEFEAAMWAGRADAVRGRVSTLDGAYAQGMIAYALKQEALFSDIAARARTTETAPRVARGKKRPRVGIVDPLAEATRRGGGWDVDLDESDGDDDERLLAAAEEGDGSEEAGEVESDEELIMGGEVDDV